VDGAHQRLGPGGGIPAAHPRPADRHPRVRPYPRPAIRHHRQHPGTSGWAGAAPGQSPPRPPRHRQRPRAAHHHRGGHQHGVLRLCLRGVLHRSPGGAGFPRAPLPGPGGPLRPRPRQPVAAPAPRRIAMNPPRRCPSRCSPNDSSRHPPPPGLESAMLIKTRRPTPIPESQVTPEAVHGDRRRILAGLGFGALLAGANARAGLLDFLSPAAPAPAVAAAPRKPLVYDRGVIPPGLVLTPEEKATNHNNFYEFGTGKTDPARHSQGLRTEPWTLRVEGEVARPGTLDVAQLIAAGGLEERIYRMRCVEAWSMVIPWVGLELGKVLKG